VSSVAKRATKTTWLATAAVLALLAPACDEDAAPPPSETANESPAPRAWPAGVVLAVDDHPIHVDEIDVATAYVERIEPAASSAQLRRLALTNVVLPRTVAMLMAPQAREEALKAAQEKLAQIRAGALTGPTSPEGAYGEYVEGTWGNLGLLGWGVAMDLADGEWSDVVEEVGHFLLVRRLWLRDGPVPMATVVGVDVLRFAWLPPETLRSDVDAALDQHRLEIVDPAWREIVPELIQHRMHAR